MWAPTESPCVLRRTFAPSSAGTIVTCFAARSFWPQPSPLINSFLSAFGATVCGQVTVLIFGAGWISEKMQFGAVKTLRVGVLPYLPGLLIKSALAAAAAVAYAQQPKQS